MGLFDKKYCDVCGEKIGLLGNRKLEDGNLCKDCAKKLSPLFSERRHSTVNEIKEQLAYREENERRLADFHPDMTFGGGKKVYVDRRNGQFIVTSASNWRNANPDLIHISQVTAINNDIHENKTEIYYKDEEGNRKSYNPRRYRCDYEFNVTILVDSPWFDKIELELSNGNRPDSPYTDLYRQYEEQMHRLSSVLNGETLMGDGNGNKNFTGTHSAVGSSGIKTKEDQILADLIKHRSWTCKTCGCMNNGTETCRECGGAFSDDRMTEIVKDIAHAAAMEENAVQGWVCPSCSSQNYGKFCENCGTVKPEIKPGICPRCGYNISGEASTPKFCPECGSPLTHSS